MDDPKEVTSQGLGSAYYLKGPKGHPIPPLSEEKEKKGKNRKFVIVTRKLFIDVPPSCKVAKLFLQRLLCKI